MEESASTAATTQLDATVTTARRATTETYPNLSHTGKPAKVQCSSSFYFSFPFWDQTFGFFSIVVVSQMSIASQAKIVEENMLHLHLQNTCRSDKKQF